MLVRVGAALTFLILGFFLATTNNVLGSEKDMQSQIKALKVQQDSMLAILKTMADQSRFVALRVGWEPPEDTTPLVIPVGKSYTTGPQDAPLTLVEFSDFQCPYCAMLAPTLDSVAKVFPKEVRVIFKHFPLSFHEQAKSGHAATLAAGKQGKFFEYRYLLAPEFRSLNDSTYLAIAKKLKLNIDQFKADMVLDKADEEIISSDIELGSKIGVRGTPTLFANGRKVQDRSFEGLVKLLEEARAKKK